MAENRIPQESPSEREDRPDDPYGAVMDPPGLRTPQGPSEAPGDVRSAQEAGGADAVPQLDLGHGVITDDETPAYLRPKIWPEDY